MLSNHLQAPRTGGENLSSPERRGGTTTTCKRRRRVQTSAGQYYQEDFVTPGISPWEASSRKVMRDILKRRR